MNDNYNSIKTIDDLKSIFPDGQADELNWCMLSTSGVHGTYTKLETIREYFSNPQEFVEEQNGGEDFEPKVTVLVVKPREISMLHGHIKVDEHDIEYLNDLVSSSLLKMSESQQGNI
ncbi:hypothetical protein [Paenibacillus taichungensis]|uniref:hypothetical protein n=1 Tax=Paenibacillus taichungensis TaxID=484184 RepID=UPI0039A50945